jgi:hypothetical protein
LVILALGRFITMRRASRLAAALSTRGTPVPGFASGLDPGQRFLAASLARFFWLSL